MKGYWSSQQGFVIIHMDTSQMNNALNTCILPSGRLSMCLGSYTTSLSIFTEVLL